MYRNDTSPRRRRTGFTLVELLAVVVIIAILASLTSMATATAMRSAREAKTRGTISKLDAAIQDIFEGYEEKFDYLNIFYNDGTSDKHISLRDAAKYAKHGNLNSGTPAASEEEIAKVRLHLIRDLMRMEMPINKNEIDTDPLKLEDAGTVWVESPHVQKCYKDAIGTHNPSNAELLFLIIMNLNPEALEQFHESEIGDVDGNGLYEFVDAWGTPIRFLRWAPGFTGTDRQPDVIARSNVALTSGNNTGLWSEQSVENEKKKASEDYHDPFDQYVDVAGDDAVGTTTSWFLYPVAFSAGPDKKFDINMGPPSYTGPYSLNSILDPYAEALGIPQNDDSDGVLNHYDNIHTHRVSGGF